MGDVPRKQILSDHKKSGKQLIPPMMSQFGDRLQLTSWPRTGIPEILWLALLHDQDEELGVGAALALSKLAINNIPSKTAYCLTSDFRDITEVGGAALWSQLSPEHQMIMAAALQPSIAAYPTCPLRNVMPSVADLPDLPRLKRVLASLFDKTSRESTMALATMLYLTVNAGRLFLHQGTRLRDLEKIREYPSTEESRGMASEVRSLTIMSFMPPHYEENSWPKEFWNRGLTLDEQRFIEYQQAWIDEQLFHFLTSVDLGSWSGVTTRTMAEQAGCLDFYNWVYTPFSAATHSAWHHVGRFNVRTCTDPLHRYHRVPCDEDLPPDFTFPNLAAKYLDQTFASFDAAIQVQVEVPSAAQIYYDAMMRQFGDPPDESGDSSESE
jgi:hypothetical protein